MLQRSSRFITALDDIDIRGNARAIATLRLFDNCRLLPFNWMHALVPNAGGYAGHRDQCTRMVRAGLLGRFTFNGTKNTSETMTYFRTDRGDTFLHARGFEGLPHDGTHDAHQVLTDLADAQIELGLRGTDIEVHKWGDILQHPNTPKQPDHPFRFPIGTHPLSKKTMYLVPDGRPFYLKRGSRTQLFLKELDRNNENPAVIQNKLKNYAVAVDAIKERYGFKNFMLLFITTNTVRQNNILRWTLETVGPCKWVLTNLIDDHVKNVRTTAPLSTALVDVPWARAGQLPFSLKTLSEA